MDRKDIADLLVRLLQLEQRFESYSRLYEEEMGEIRETLLHLREDALKLAQASEENLNTGEPQSSEDGHSLKEEPSLDHFSDDLSI